MIRPLVALALVLTLAACDFAGDSVVRHQPTFDYIPGPDQILNASGARALPATPGAAVMQIHANTQPRPGGSLFVTWAFPRAPAPLPYAEAYPIRAAFELLVRDEPVDIAGGVVSDLTTRDCNTYDGTSSSFTLRETRVPASASPGDQRMFTDCTGAAEVGFTVRGTEHVTVPAGTVEALVLVGEPRFRSTGDQTVEYWTATGGLVRVDLLTAGGVLRGSPLRAAQAGRAGLSRSGKRRRGRCTAPC